MGGETMQKKIKSRKIKVGVFVDRALIQKLLDQDPPKRLFELHKANEVANTNLYFFSHKNINYDTLQIKGTYYNTLNHRWEQKSFPFPNVFYNRVSGGLDRKRYKRLREILEENKIKRLNTRGDFNKWDLYKHLMYFRELQPYLPFTQNIHNDRMLMEVLRKFPNVYIKAIKSRRGLGVLRVLKKESGYEISHFRTKLVTKEVKSLNELLHYIASFFKGKKIIVQTAIPSVVPNKTMDMRAEVQRNKYGKLEVVGISPRLANSRFPVLSSRINPKIYTFETFTTNVLKLSDSETIKLKKQIEHVLINVYERLEQIYGPFGELGIDLILDEKMRIWFIEANATSSKIALYRSYDKETVRKAFLNPLQYAKFISKND